MKPSSLAGVAALLALLLLFLAPSVQANEKKLHVLTTFAPITSLTRNVAGDAAHVEQLLPPNAHAHHFALRPSHLKKLAKADLIIENGLGMEEWLDSALKTSSAKRISASAGIKTIDDDPHVWLDPIHAISQVENIRKALVAADPSRAEIFNKNAAATTARLKALDAEIRTAFSALKERRLLTSHSAFDYFARRYDLRVVGVFEAFPGRTPTPKALKELRETIEREKIKVIFTEPGKPRRTLLALSKELGLPVVEIDPMEEGKGNADQYEKVTRKNMRNFKEALGAAR